MVSQLKKTSNVWNLYKMNGSIEKQLRQKHIDYLKVIAILFIVFTHDPWSVEHAGHPLFTFFIDMAVPIFMVVSGYNYVCSCNRNRANTIRNLYDGTIIWGKAKRFLFPYLITFLGEVLLLVFFKHKAYTISSLCLDMIKGGYGPGAYYTPIMMQFVFIVPLIYVLIHKKRGWGLVISFFANFIFECLYTYLNIPGAFYARCIFRYLFLISIGITWGEMELRKVNKVIYTSSFIIGLLYILGTCYLWSPIIFTRWTTTSMMVGFYLFPILLVFQRLTQKIELPNTMEESLILCSKSTYHIYLVQMVYYFIGIERIFGNLPVGLRMLFSIVICVSGGCVFYKLLSLLLNRKKRTHYE